jgi:hypothetical protein
MSMLLPRKIVDVIVDPAFVSSTRVSNPTARVKGREKNTFQLAIATPTSTHAKSTSPRPTAKTSPSKTKQNFTAKGKKNVFVKNAPKRTKSMRSNSTNTKTFKPLKDLR